MFPRTVSQLRFPLSIYSKFLLYAIFLYNRVQRRTQKLQYATGFLKIILLYARQSFASSTHDRAI